MAATLPRKVLLLAALTVTAAGALAYHNALGAGSTNFDDRWQVTENPLVRTPSLENAWKAVSRPYHGLYLPVKILSYMADYAVSEALGIDPVFGVHLTNVVLHVANSVLVCVICMLLLLDLAGDRIGRDGAVFSGLFAGVLFVLHPVHVESVAWLSGRKDVLSFFFMALSLLVFRRAVGAGGAWRAVLSAALFALALGAKTTAACLPLVATAYWFLLWRPGGRRAAFLLAALYALALAAVAVADFHATRAGYEGGPVGGSYLVHWLTVMKTFPFYMRLLMFPVNLSAIYTLPEASGIADAGVWWGIAMALAQVAVVVFVRSRTVRMIVLWYLLSLLPVLQIVPTAVPALAADRYAYIPSVAFALAPALILWKVRTVLARTGAMAVATVLVAAGVVYAGTLGAAAWSRNRVWHDSKTLWEDCLWKNPDSLTALANLAEVYSQEADLQSAELLYLRAVKVDPSYILAQYNLGVVYEKMDAPFTAKRFFTDALWRPSSLTERYTRRYRALAALRLGAISYREGKYRGARKYAQTAVKWFVPEAEAERLLAAGGSAQQLGRALIDDWDDVVDAVLLFKSAEEAATESEKLADALVGEGDKVVLSRGDEAAAHYQRAAEAAPEYCVPRERLGRLQLMHGRYDEAYREFAAAFMRGAEGADFEHDFGMAALVTGRYESAERSLTRALALEPTMQRAMAKLALAKARLGKKDEALKLIREALELDPSDADALQIQKMITAPGGSEAPDAEPAP